MLHQLFIVTCTFYQTEIDHIISIAKKNHMVVMSWPSGHWGVTWSPNTECISAFKGV